MIQFYSDQRKLSSSSASLRLFGRQRIFLCHSTAPSRIGHCIAYLRDKWRHLSQLRLSVVFFVCRIDYWLQFLGPLFGIGADASRPGR
jgi:hypothetical protein